MNINPRGGLLPPRNLRLNGLYRCFRLVKVFIPNNKLKHQYKLFKQLVEVI